MRASQVWSAECEAYLAKVNLVKDDLVGVADAPEARDETENGHDGQGNPVVPFAARLLLGSSRLDELVEFNFIVGTSVGRLSARRGGGDVSLAQGALRRSGSRHDAVRDC